MIHVKAGEEAERSAGRCSRKGHGNAKAVMYCTMCEENFCPECAAVHRDILPRHAKYERVKTSEEDGGVGGGGPIFTGKCAVQNHYKSPLVYFCHTHNVLCCAECRNPGEAHCSCKVDQLKNLDVAAMRQALPADLAALAAEIQTIGAKEDTVAANLAEFEKRRDEFERDIEVVRTAINTAFNKLREALDSRETELMTQLESIRSSQDEEANTPDTTTKNLRAEAVRVLAAGRRVAESWDDERLREMVKAVADVRCETAKIKSVISGADEIATSFPKLKFDDGLDEITRKIGSTCEIRVGSPGSKYVGEWRDAPNCRTLQGNPTIVVATGNNRAADITKTPLGQRAVTKWRIKFLRNGDGWWLWLGVAPASINLAKTNNDTECGWYLNTHNSTLYSGPPHKYGTKEYANGKARDFEKGSVIDVTMDTTDGTLSFSRGKESFGPAYLGIPLNEPLYPAVIFNCEGHSVQFLPYEI